MEDPKKALQFVLAFAPGFLALGLFVYNTDVVFSDLHFVFIAIGLTVAIHATYRYLRELMFNTTEYSTSEPGIFVVSALLGLALIPLYERDILLVGPSKDSSKRPWEMIQLKVKAHKEDIRPWAQIYVEDLGVVIGLPHYVSQANEPDEIFLSPACVHKTESFASFDAKKLRYANSFYVPGSRIVAFEELRPPANTMPCPWPE